MLPTSATHAMEQFSSTATNFVGVMVISAAIANLAAQTVGGRSRQTRQIVFGAVMLIGLCGAMGYFFITGQHRGVG